MDHASTRSAIAEANRLEPPKPLSLSIPVPAASNVNSSISSGGAAGNSASGINRHRATHPKSFFARMVSALKRRFGFAFSSSRPVNQSAVNSSGASGATSSSAQGNADSAMAAHAGSSNVSAQPSPSSTMNSIPGSQGQSSSQESTANSPLVHLGRNSNSSWVFLGAQPWLRFELSWGLPLPRRVRRSLVLGSPGTPWPLVLPLHRSPVFNLQRAVTQAAPRPVCGSICDKFFRRFRSARAFSAHAEILTWLWRRMRALLTFRLSHRHRRR